MAVSRLRVFPAVAETLRFGHVARSPHPAQPYLRRTVELLEDDLGTPSSARTTRRVELTPAGAALVDRSASPVRL